MASSAIVARLEREHGAEVAVARFSAGRAGGLPERWSPFTVSLSTPRTDYRLVNTGQGIVLEARADRSSSGLYRRIRIDPKQHPIVEWRWNVAQSVPGADPSIASRDDSAARLVISFHGDVTRLDFMERVTLRLFKSLTGESLPFAMLMYVWSSELPPGTIVPSEHTEKIQVIVVESGDARTGQWVEFRRNVLEDYRRAFGEEPWDIVAVGVMTDSDNTGESARAWYGDITFRGVKQ
ncbi:MAG: DUF3047 domain-containing protein [Burkholderiales bacterium]